MLRKTATTLLWLAPVPLVVIGIFSALAASCSSTRTPLTPTVADERAVILLTAKGVVEANKACASKGEEMRIAASGNLPKLTKAKELVDKCGVMTRTAAGALEAAEAAIDARDEIADGRARCALKAGLEAIDAIEAAGVSMPKVVDDAKAVARPIVALIVGACS